MGRAQLEREPDLLSSRVAAVRPDHLATLVYTSGTTGLPKGAMITHGNVIWTLRNATHAIQIREGERLISFLPLSHIAERMMSDFLPIGYGGETWFARSLTTVAEDLPDCRPTIFFAVPRVWEKLHDKVAEKLAAEQGLKKRLIDTYVRLGLRKVAFERDGTPMPVLGMRRWHLLDKAIGRKIRHTLGLDQAHVLVTAAAPIHPDLLRWYHAIGLPVLELYGQTEDCGPTSTNTPAQTRIGSVGQPWPGTTVRIADDGEILVQGGNVCMGYFRDEAGTAALLGADGFMHSGDLGRFDADGYLYITGRKKDLIITAAGKNIAPQELETDLRHHPLISQAVVVGEGRRYLTVLVTLDPDEVASWAAKRGKPTDPERLADDPDVLAEVQAAIDDVNAKRSHAEAIRKFRVLPHDLSAAAGELTPTLKVKRNVVYEQNAALIEDMYTDAAP
jgi:long-chain acyl-CoA synthetase